MRMFVLIATLLAAFCFAAVPATADPPPADDAGCPSDPFAAIDAGCPDAAVAPEAAAALSQAQAAAPALADVLPPSCRLHAEAVFWTANDWLLLSQALAGTPRPVRTTTSRSRRSPVTRPCCGARKTTSSARSGRTSTRSPR